MLDLHLSRKTLYLLSPRLCFFPVHVLICDFAVYNYTFYIFKIRIDFIFNTYWMANTEIVLDPNNSYKEVVVYFFYHGDSFTSFRVTMRIEQLT